MDDILPCLYGPVPAQPSEDYIGNALKRVVPNKSKLSILGSRKDGAERVNGRKDFSDVARRVGISGANEKVENGSLRGGFEIYVDPTDDPDIGGEHVHC